MANKNIPKINIDEIMEKIREEVAKRKKLTYQENELLTDNNTFSHLQETAIWRFIKRVQYKLQKYSFYNYVYNVAYKFKKLIPKYKNQLEIKDLLKYKDEEFIKNAYRAVLRREADPAGLNRYLTRLKNGELNRIDILGRLRYSKEGRQKRVRIRGLLIRFLTITPLYFFRYIFKVFVSIIELPKLTQKLDQKADIQDIKEIKEDIGNLYIQMKNHNSYLHNLQENLTSLSQKLKDKFEETKMPDSMYMALENKFRGSVEDIKKRVEFYLTFIKLSNAGTEDAPILDVGCGRGEWLSVLKENGYIAKGIDCNTFMVQKCKDIGLDVIESDVIEYLRNQEANSFGVITAFHLIEHLPLNTLIKFLEESLRVLKHQGLLILETPNPESVRVSTCNFYTDPTHRSLLPSSLMKFLLEFQGFSKIEVLNLHPYPERFKSANSSDVTEHINKYFYGSRDYVITGWKE